VNLDARGRAHPPWRCLAIVREPPPPPLDNALAQARAATLAKIGQLDDRGITRAPPARTGVGSNVELVPWPSLTVGKLRMVRRPQTSLVVTDGLSDPWDPGLHGSVPAFRFGCELAIEVPRPDDAAPVPVWVAALLFGVSNWLINGRFDLRARLRAHPCTTLGALPVPGLEAWQAANGLHGLLLGVPFVGETLGAHAILGRDRNEAVWLLPLKLLHPAEYAWALGVRDSSRATWLVQSFLQSDRHLSRTDRGPIIGQT
jgi:hypothetical protein